MGDIDTVLHAERAVRGGGKVTFDAPLGELPVGTFFKNGDEIVVVAKQGFLRWTFGGYSACEAGQAERIVKVLTPASIVRMYKSGFMPCLDSSALTDAVESCTR